MTDRTYNNEEPPKRGYKAKRDLRGGSRSFAANGGGALADEVTEPSHGEVVWELGSVVAKRYVLQTHLGRGRYGEIYRALDRSLSGLGQEHHVALHLLHDRIRDQTRVLERLENASLQPESWSHPNVVKVAGFGRDRGKCFLVMELLEGASLRFVLDDASPVLLSKEESFAILRSVGDALKYAHAKGAVHGDVRPEKVFVTAGFAVKVLDLLPASAARTAPFFVEDTAPNGLVIPDRRDDVYGLACVAYELLSGKHPFNANSPLEALRAGFAPPPLTGLKWSRWEALAQGLALHREQRTPSIAQFLEGLGVTGLEQLRAASSEPAVGVAPPDAEPIDKRIPVVLDEVAPAAVFAAPAPAVLRTAPPSQPAPAPPAAAPSQDTAPPQPPRYAPPPQYTAPPQYAPPPQYIAPVQLPQYASPPQYTASPQPPQYGPLPQYAAAYPQPQYAPSPQYAAQPQYAPPPPQHVPPPQAAPHPQYSPPPPKRSVGIRRRLPEFDVRPEMSEPRRQRAPRTRAWLALVLIAVAGVAAYLQYEPFRTGANDLFAAASTFAEGVVARGVPRGADSASAVVAPVEPAPTVVTDSAVVEATGVVVDAAAADAPLAASADMAAPQPTTVIWNGVGAAPQGDALATSNVSATSQPAHFAFAAGLITISEWQAVAPVVIRRLGGVEGEAAVVWWTSDGTAAADDDYASFGARVEKFAAGEEERTVHVPIVIDSVVESQESFYVNLGGSERRGRRSESAEQTKVVIVDDDF